MGGDAGFGPPPVRPGALILPGRREERSRRRNLRRDRRADGRKTGRPVQNVKKRTKPGDGGEIKKEGGFSEDKKRSKKKR